MQQNNYWVIRWNATVRGKKRSSRMFETFLDTPLPFESYGYSGKSVADVRRFEKVERGDQVFCFQGESYKLAEGTYVARCEVKAIESDAPGGLCLLLEKRETLDYSVRNFTYKKTLCKLRKGDLITDELLEYLEKHSKPLYDKMIKDLPSRNNK